MLHAHIPFPPLAPHQHKSHVPASPTVTLYNLLHLKYLSRAMKYASSKLPLPHPSHQQPIERKERRWESERTPNFSSHQHQLQHRRRGLHVHPAPTTAAEISARPRLPGHAVVSVEGCNGEIYEFVVSCFEDLSRRFTAGVCRLRIRDVAVVYDARLEDEVMLKRLGGGDVMPAFGGGGGGGGGLVRREEK